MPTEDPIENLSWYNEEMEECAAGYAAYVVELLETAKQTCTDPVVMIEQRVNFSRWVQDGFGTADCIVIADGVMNICDYKHGKGVEVSAVANPQMMLYALGALEIFDDIYDIDTVRMTIFQPRKANISVYEMEKADLLEWADTDLTQKAKLSKSPKGRQFRFNINNPTSEKTHLQVTNDGSIFANLGERIIVGGWMNPTTYSVGNTFCPIFNTRYGPGQPIFYLSLYSGRPRIMLYNSSGSLILDQSLTPSFKLVNGGWYFIAGVIEPTSKQFTYVVGDRSTGEVWKSDVLTFTGELNRSCVADLVIGMHADTYYYAGGFDDWFLDCDSALTADDLVDYFRATVLCNGADSSSDVDALTDVSGVTLKATDGVYPESGVISADGQRQGQRRAVCL